MSSRPRAAGDIDALVDVITRKVLEELSGAAPGGVAAAPGSAAASGSHGADAEHDAQTCERCRSWGVCGSRGPEETRMLAEAGA